MYVGFDLRYLSQNLAVTNFNWTYLDNKVMNSRLDIDWTY